MTAPTPRRAALVVFAKEPRPGNVKTRLVPPLSEQQACDLYAAMLRDVLASTAQLAQKRRLDAWCAVHPPEAVRRVAARLAPRTPLRIVAQRGADLAERMDWAVREAAAGGAQRIVLRGSDSPMLAPEAIERAFDQLERADLVVGPDRDGGYNLIGMRAPARGLFDHAMSTRTVLHDTLANAERLGLRVRSVDAAFDVDTAEDLEHLVARVLERTDLATQLCNETLAFAKRELADWIA